jgi:hypothetical protein
MRETGVITSKITRAIMTQNSSNIYRSTAEVSKLGPDTTFSPVHSNILFSCLRGHFNIFEICNKLLGHEIFSTLKITHSY